MTEALRQLQELVRDIPDYPKEGIVFKDITPLLQSGHGLKVAVDALAEAFAGDQIDVVVGVESRGFIFAAPLALQLGCGFVPVRKPGKLPADVLRQEYQLEYGTDTLEIHRDGIDPDQRVLVVDDVLATGGTMAASCQLVEALGGRIAGLGFVIELSFLGGKEKLANYTTKSLIQY